MNKKIIYIVLLILATMPSVFAQVNNPVSWKFMSEKTGSDEFTLTFQADISPDWYLYSQNIEEGGPIPTTFTFTPSDDYQLVGKVIESEENRETIQDEVFQMELIKFHNTAIFTQKVKVLDAKKPIKGSIRYMSCSGDRCNPPVQKDFSFSL